MESNTEKNREIAEFMGIKWKPFRNDSTNNYSAYVEKLFDTFEECEKFCSGFNAAKCNSTHFDTYIPMLECIKCKYDTDWNWLMPVVGKIESFGYAIVDIHREATIIKVYDGEECIWKTNQWNQESKIDHVYQAVTQFLHWYKEQEK